MIITLMNQKLGLNRFSKLPEDGHPWAPNNLLKPGAKEKHQLRQEQETRSSGPNHLK